LQNNKIFLKKTIGKNNTIKTFNIELPTMKIFKFGGASVKDAAGVRNVASVIQQFGGSELLVVISAMGKTTNALLFSSNGQGAREFAKGICLPR
jgi:aspartokinase